MNQKLVEEVARAIAYSKHSCAGTVCACWRGYVSDAQAAIRVCMARAVKICEETEEKYGYDSGCGYAAADEIKREGGLT